MTKILNGCGLGVKLGLKYLENGKNYLFSEDFSGIHSVQPQQGMELQEKEAHKDQSIHEICLERTEPALCN